MSQHTTTSHARTPEAATLDEVYRRLARVHATLAEADSVDETLHGRTLDWLMDIMELIDTAPSPTPQATPARTGSNAEID